MMENEKEFDDLMKSIVAKKASANFTSKTIQRISAQLDTQKAYRPIIPKAVWFILAALFTGLSVFTFLNSSGSEIDFSWFYVALENLSANLIYFIPLLVLLLIESTIRLNKVNHFLK